MALANPPLVVELLAYAEFLEGIIGDIREDSGAYRAGQADALKECLAFLRTSKSYPLDTEERRQVARLVAENMEGLSR